MKRASRLDTFSLECVESIHLFQSGVKVDSDMSHVLASGTLVANQYKIEDVIGEGGMGTVYRARELALDRVVAIKILKEKLAASTRDLERFVVEGQTTAKLVHANIVRVYKVDIWQGFPYFAMEYVEGNNLESLLNEGVTLSLGLQILEKTALALSAAHEAGLIHRDLKPENILVSCDDTSGVGPNVKVVDWGIARTITAPKRLTRTGMVLGTPHYMAPEQISAGELSPSTDLYSLGVILFRLLTGQLPFDSSVLTEVLSKHLREQAPSVRSLAPGVPKELAHLVSALLSKKGAERPESALKVAKTLRKHFTSSEQMQLPSRTRVVKKTRKSLVQQKALPKKHRSPIWGIAAFFLLCLVLVGSFFRTQDGAEHVSNGFIQLREVQLLDINKVRLRIEGKVPAGTSLVTTAFSLLLPEKGYDQITSSVSSIEVELPKPITDDIQVALVNANKSSKKHLLKPRLLKPVRQIRKFRDSRLLYLLDELSKTKKRPERVLVDAGFDSSFDEWLTRQRDVLLPNPTLLNSPSCRFLWPIFLLERTSLHRGGRNLPWKPILSQLHMEQSHLARSRSYPNPVPGEVLGRVNCQKTIKDEDSSVGKLRCLWIHSPEQVKRAKAEPKKFIDFSNRLTFSSKLAKARLSDWQEIRRELLMIKKPHTGKWPPAKIRLVVDTHFFTHDRTVQISFNGGEPYSLFRTIGLEPGQIHYWVENCLRISIPLAAKDLRLGKNIVTFRAKLLSNKVPLNGTRFVGFAVVVPSEGD